jgi:hypothetical protein
VAFCKTRREPYLTARDGGNADFAGAKICPVPLLTPQYSLPL